MDAEGNIHRDVTQEEAEEQNLSELTEEEAAELEKIPVDHRHEVLQKMRALHVARLEQRRRREHALRMAADQRAAERRRKKKFAKTWNKRAR